MKTSLKDRLKAAGIRHFDDLIHDQSREWLQKYFKKGASKYPVNVARLMRNIIWQVRERIRYGEKPLIFKSKLEISNVENKLDSHNEKPGKKKFARIIRQNLNPV
ncbi:MAG: hypothetical protein U9N73_07365 [Candidatus Auribacterota bacterium]|nr:hypothetical protein [Candidatus Auribacterota bacterium]